MSLNMMESNYLIIYIRELIILHFPVNYFREDTLCFELADRLLMHQQLWTANWCSCLYVTTSHQCFQPQGSWLYSCHHNEGMLVLWMGGGGGGGGERFTLVYSSEVMAGVLTD